ncbi:MAG: bifunctional 4-hydroxy-2-oxoglutarate aldolase/2-dehydro-3-deoxy-phosphogluconate aldolase [Verrucomicrobiota bacterium]|nr:bifunctional 4-hydroxy-2-oxoglutarate aldolase/2-dehydro-3-deoxy-phosphogluconate aldolase [Verrucomicrobiota bacterium]
MARFSRLEVLNRIVATGLMPVFYHPDAETACQVATACAAGGATTFEFTNRGDEAPEVFRLLVQHCRKYAPTLILGAGTIFDEATAALFVAHGANFIVGPSFNPGVARFCNRRKIPYMPGCLTPTEIADAEEAGVEIVKVFPCESAGGPEFVKAILGPSPWTRIMPTGIHNLCQHSLMEWFNAGVTAVGVGGELMKTEFLEQRDYPAMTRHAEEMLGWVRAARLTRA